MLKLFRACLFICYQTMFTCVFSQARELFWNSSTETWLEFHVGFCGRVCRDGEIHLPGFNKCDMAHCFPCDCNPSCHIYDTCCPTWTDGVLTAPVTTNTDIWPHSERFQCQRPTSDPLMNSYYMISDCEHGFGGSSLKGDAMNSDMDDVSKLAGHVTIQRCRNPDTKTLSDVTPYLDLQYGIVFKNKFCAICNGYQVVEEDEKINKNESDHIKFARAWSLEVSCDHYQHIFNVTTKLEFFKAASKRVKRGCQVKFVPPTSRLQPRTCSVEFQESINTNCTSSDAILNEHCYNLGGRYLRLTTSRNIFCHMCSGKTRFKPCRFPDALKPIPINRQFYNFYVSPISLLVSLDSRQQPQAQEIQNCSSARERLWTKEECKQADCSQGKQVTKNGTCTSVIKQIRGLGYKMTMKLSTTNTVLVNRQHVQNLHREIFQQLRVLSNDMELKTMMKIDCGLEKSDKRILYEILLESFLIGDAITGRDDFELRLIKMADNFGKFQLSSDTSTALNVTLIPLLLGMELANISVPDVAFESSFMCPQQTIFLSGTENQEWEGVESSKARFCTYACQQDTIKVHHTLWMYKQDFIDVTYSLTCPYVFVNITKLSIDNHSASVSFEHEGRTVEIKSLQNISLVDGQLRICIDLFKMVTEVTQSTGSIIMILYYFQVVCVFVSIVCLILSFVTFCLFPSLRSLPGLNNMSLCLTLAIAQTCLLITVQFGVHRVLPPIYCLLHAIILHYSWLASFLWMSACCVHMFRVFTCHGNQFINTRSDKQRHLKYCLYAYGVPLSIVALTLAINAALTSGAFLGYDDTICFLDTRTSPMNIALSLLLPLCCMVLSNSVLFVMTVRRIITVSNVLESTTGREGQGVITYVKLSTLTGSFCIVAAVSVWLNNIPLQFVTSPLMALQGVFIFFSFIVNRRVGKLYSNLMCWKKSTDVPSSSDRSLLSLRKTHAFTSRSTTISTPI